jgi:DNA-binding NtrC family response regulator
MAHILVIDDDAALREAVVLALQHQGHRVSEAENGRIGVTRHLADKADLVITDLIMPEQEGVETIIQLRRHDPRLRVIAMSGGGPRAGVYLGICERLGVCSTLAKPFRIDDLRQAVNRALGAPSAT